MERCVDLTFRSAFIVPAVPWCKALLVLPWPHLLSGGDWVVTPAHGVVGRDSKGSSVSLNGFSTNLYSEIATPGSELSCQYSIGIKLFKDFLSLHPLAFSELPIGLLFFSSLCSFLRMPAAVSFHVLFSLG